MKHLLLATVLFGLLSATALGQCYLQNDAAKPYYVMGNGVFALRVPKAGAQSRTDWAPVQAVVYANNGKLELPPEQPVFLTKADAATGNCNDWVPPYKMEEQVKASKDSVVITYKYYFKNIAPCINVGKNLAEGGNKQYTAIVKIIKGEKCAMVSDESNRALQYSIPVSYAGYQFSTAQYRGGIANNIDDGYEYSCGNTSEKKEYGSSFGRRASQYAGYDALVDLKENKTYEPMVVWNHSPVNTGWYWQAYGPGNAVIGFFHGRISRFLGSRQAMVRFKTAAARQLWVNVNLYLLNSDNSFQKTLRQEWYLFAGNRQQDIKPVEAFQPIALLLNEKMGISGRVDGYLKTVMNPGANFFKGEIYESAATIKKMLEKLRYNSPGYDGAFYNKMMQMHGGHYGASVIKAIQYPAMVEKPCWTSEGYCLANPNPKMTRLDHIYEYIKECFDEVIFELKNGDGIYAAGIKNLNQYRRKGVRHCGTDLASDDVNNANNCDVGYESTGKSKQSNELTYIRNCGSFTLKYPHYAQNFKRDVQAISLLLAADDDDWQKGPYGQKLTPQQKSTLLTIASTYAKLLYDPELYPDLERNEGGFDYGTLNTWPFFAGARNFMGLIYAGQPGVPSTVVKETIQEVRNSLSSYVNAYGASAGSTAYMATGVESAVENMLLLKRNKHFDFFAADKRMKAFAEFYLHLSSPPSVRYSYVPASSSSGMGVKKYRKVISYGDGQEKSSLLPALLATGFKDLHPQLSLALAGCYKNGPAYPYQGSGYASMITDQAAVFSGKEDNNALPSFMAGNAHFPGYLSHFRSGVNTPNESATWMINGNWYRDHRCEDEGELTIYALGAPLSVSRSTSYTPRTNSARARSVVTPFDMKTGDARENFVNWNGDNQAIDRRDFALTAPILQDDPVLQRLWSGRKAEESNTTGFASFKNSGYTKAVFSTFTKDRDWTREILQLQFNDAMPLIVMKDSVTTPTENIWSMPFMSVGPIKKINGNNTITDYKPTDQLTVPLYAPADLPDATPAGGAPMPPGIHRFRFTGQQWHPLLAAEKGIDWEVFAINPSGGNRSFATTQWTHIARPAELEWQDFMNTYSNDPSFAIEQCDCKKGGAVVKSIYRTTHPLLNPPPRPTLANCPAGSDNISFSQYNTFRETQQFLRIKGSGSFITLIVPYRKNQSPASLSLQEEAGTAGGPKKYTLTYNGTTVYFFGLNTVCLTGGRTILTTTNSQLLRQGDMQLQGGPAELELNNNTATLTVHGDKGTRTVKLPAGRKWVLQNKDAAINFNAATGIATVQYAGMGQSYWYSPSSPAANAAVVYRFVAQ
jgi:hypothetical protein